MEHTEGLQQRLSHWSVRRPGLVMGFAALSATVVALLLPIWGTALLAAGLLISCLIRCCFWRLFAVTAALLLLTGGLYRVRLVQPLTPLEGQMDVITGQVVELPINGRMVTLEVTQAQQVPVGTRVALFLPSEKIPQRWDTITAQVTLTRSRLSGYQQGQGVHLAAFPLEYDDLCVQVSDGSVPLTSQWSNDLYATLCRNLPDEEGAVLAALCLGRGEAVSDATEEAFRGSGLSHLLVMSGLHLSLVVLAVRMLLRRTGRRLSVMLTIPLMGLFMALVGASPSIVRAGLMCLCWLCGILARRRSAGLNSLGLAAVVLLAINPYQLFSASFQLSFLATAGVLCLPSRLCGWLNRLPEAKTRPGRLGQKLVSFVYTAVAVCFSALLFTLPVSCYYFGGFSASALLANLLAVVPAGWVLLWGWLGLLCCSVPFLTWLGQPILLLAGYGARYLTTFARWFSFDWAQVSVSTWWQWLLLTLLCGLTAYALLARVSLARVVPALLTLAVLGLSTGHLLATPTATVTVQPYEVGAAVLVEQGEHRALLVTHSHQLDDVLWMLDQRHCTRLDWLVVADGSWMDSGLLAQLYRQTGGPRVLTADAEDWFAGVSFAVERLPFRQTLTLWEGCTLHRTTKTWWYLAWGDHVVQVGGDAGVSCPAPEGMILYAGVPTRLNAPAVVACTAAQLAEKPPNWAEEALIVTDDLITFTAHPGGEWSVLPWL